MKKSALPGTCPECGWERCRCGASTKQLTTPAPVELLPLGEAVRLLARMKNLDEVRRMGDLAEAARVYARAQGLGAEAQNHAGAISVEAQIRQGEILKEMADRRERAKPGDARVDVSDGTKREPSAPTLADLGMTKRQAANAQAVAAEADKVREWMESAPLVTPAKAAREAMRERHRRETSEAPPLPEGVFDVILADPPWEYSNSGGLPGQVSNHYGTMTMADIAAMDLPAAENAVLFLWVTAPMLAEGLDLCRAWGFAYKTHAVWIKRNLKKPGVGFYVRGRHELLFIATRGSMVPDQEGRSPIGSVIEADIRSHSEKPDEAYALIEGIYPGGKYLELFARRNRPGWTAWGSDRALVLAASDSVGARGENAGGGSAWKSSAPACGASPC